MRTVSRRNALFTGTTLAAASALGSPFEFAPSPAKAETSDAPAFKSASIKDELLYQRAIQSYLWALPLLNMRAMKEGSEAKFGAGYNVLPIWKKRMSAVTLVTTPNSDVIYAMGYLDLKVDGPMVIEAPPGLQGILDDFWQRPIRMVGQFEGRDWSGDVGLPGPDKGKGGNYLVLPLTIPATHRLVISPTAHAHTVYSYFGAVFFKTPSSSMGRSRSWSRRKFILSARKRAPSRCSFQTHSREHAVCA
jgi:hypothetical protein